MRPVRRIDRAAPLPSQVEKVLKYAKDNSEAYPDLFVTGHSLGGALSVLCALYNDPP